MQFQSPHDGRQMLLTPEHSISLQNSIGADVIMQLDDVVASLTTGPRVEEVWSSFPALIVGNASEHPLAGSLHSRS